jgi:hypothetical protein
MAAGGSSYEGISMQDHSRAHLGHNFSEGAAPVEVDLSSMRLIGCIDSSEAQNIPGQTVHGTQNIYM